MRKSVSPQISIVIMAGGSGGSFSPISQYMPKSLAFVGDKPIIHHILSSFHNVSINKIYIVVGRFGEMIEGYVRDMRSLDYSVEFVKSHADDNTAGCLFRLKHQITNTFLVYYGDILLEGFDFSTMVRFHRKMSTKYGVSGTIAFSRSYPLNVGILRLSKSKLLLRNILEKPTGNLFNVNMGITIFEPSIFDHITDTGLDLFSTVIPYALKNGAEFAVFEHHNRWWHIHTLADLYRLLYDQDLNSTRS